MKKFYKSLSVLVLLFLFNSCTKEVAVNSSFDFELYQQTYSKQIVINLASKNVIEIIPEKEVTTTSYSYKYEILKGSGAIYDEQGTIISQNVYQELDDLSFDFNYKSTEIGIENIRITVKNNDSKTTVLEYSHEIIQNDYQLNLTAPKLETTINKGTLFNVVLDNNGVDKSVTFQQSITLETGNAKVFDANNNEIELNKFNPTVEGTSTFTIVFSTPESSILRVETKDSNGQIQRQTITFSVKPIDFSFASYAVQSTANVNDVIDLRFELTKETNNNENYILLFEQTSNGVFTYNGTVYQIGSPIPIAKLDAQNGFWNATYRGTTAGSNNLNFKLSTNYSETKNSNISINFNDTTPSLNNVALKYDRINTSSDIRANPATYNVFIKLENLEYTSILPITHYEINGQQVLISTNFAIGSLIYSSTSNRGSSIISINDTNIIIKKGSTIQIRVKNSLNQYSGTATVTTPAYYFIESEVYNNF